MKPLQTERLIIREFELSDLQDIHQIISNKEVMTYSIHGPYTLEESTQFVNDVIKSYQDKMYSSYAVALKSSGKVIGFAGLADVNIENRDEIELGYRINKEYWGNGYATEATKACVEHAFKFLNLDRIIAIVDLENTASIRVVEKLNFKVDYRTKFHEYIVDIYALQNQNLQAAKK